MYIRIVLGFVPTFFTSKYSFSSVVGYVMRPILLIMWTAFQSFILRHNNNKTNPSVRASVTLKKKARNEIPKIPFCFGYNFSI